MSTFTAVTVRPATLADIPLVLLLMQHYWNFEQIDGFDPARLRVTLQVFLQRSELGFALLAMQDQAALGYCLCSKVFSFEYGGITVTVDELYVGDQVRGQGIGAELLRVAEQQMSSHGCVHIEMEVALHNQSALRFYKRHGYRSRSGFLLMQKSIR